MSNGKEQQTTVTDPPEKKKELLQDVWQSYGGEEVGSFDSFKEAFSQSPEIREQVWQAYGGEKVGDLKSFEQATLGEPTEQKEPPKLKPEDVFEETEYNSIDEVQKTLKDRQGKLNFVTGPMSMGRLPEKEEKWQQEIEQLNSIMNRYEEAVQQDKSLANPQNLNPDEYLTQLQQVREQYGDVEDTEKKDVEESKEAADYLSDSKWLPALRVGLRSVTGGTVFSVDPDVVTEELAKPQTLERMSEAEKLNTYAVGINAAYHETEEKIKENYGKDVYDDLKKVFKFKDQGGNINLDQETGELKFTNEQGQEVDLGKSFTPELVQQIERDPLFKKMGALAQKQIETSSRIRDLGEKYPLTKVVQDLAQKDKKSLDELHKNSSGVGRALLSAATVLSETPREFASDAIEAGINIGGLFNPEIGVAYAKGKEVEQIPNRTDFTSSRQKRPVRERVINFQGYKVGVDDDGEPIAFYDEEGYATDAPSQEFIDEFNESGLGESAEKQWNGESLVYNGLKTARDVGITMAYTSTGMGAGLGAGSAITAGVAFQYNNDFLQEGIEAGLDFRSAYGSALARGIKSGLINRINPLEAGIISSAFSRGVNKANVEALRGAVTAGTKNKNLLFNISMQMVAEQGEEQIDEFTDVQWMDFLDSKLDDVDHNAKFDALEVMALTGFATLAPATTVSIANYNQIESDPFYRESLYKAAASPEKYTGILSDLVEKGSLKQKDADAQRSRIESHANKYSELLDSDRLTEGQKMDVIANADIIYVNGEKSTKLTGNRKQASDERVQQAEEEIKTIEEALENDQTKELEQYHKENGTYVGFYTTDEEVIIPEDLEALVAKRDEAVERGDADAVQELEEAMKGQNIEFDSKIDEALEQEQVVNDVTIPQRTEDVRTKRDRAVEEGNRTAVRVLEQELGRRNEEFESRLGEVQETPEVEAEAPNQRSEQVGSVVRYGNQEGTLVQEDGLFYVENEGGRTLVEAALSDRTNEEIGLEVVRPAEEIEIDEDVARGEGVETDFTNNKVFAYGKEYDYQQTNTNEEGEVVSVTVVDQQGNERTIRSEDVVAQIETDKILFELENQGNDITEGNIIEIAEREGITPERDAADVQTEGQTEVSETPTQRVRREQGEEKQRIREIEDELSDWAELLDQELRELSETDTQVQEMQNNFVRQFDDRAVDRRDNPVAKKTNAATVAAAVSGRVPQRIIDAVGEENIEQVKELASEWRNRMKEDTPTRRAEELTAARREEAQLMREQREEQAAELRARQEETVEQAPEETVEEVEQETTEEVTDAEEGVQYLRRERGGITQILRMTPDGTKTPINEGMVPEGVEIRPEKEVSPLPVKTPREAVKKATQERQSTAQHSAVINNVRYSFKNGKWVNQKGKEVKSRFRLLQLNNQLSQKKRTTFSRDQAPKTKEGIESTFGKHYKQQKSKQGKVTQSIKHRDRKAVGTPINKRGDIKTLSNKLEGTAKNVVDSILPLWNFINKNDIAVTFHSSMDSYANAILDNGSDPINATSSEGFYNSATKEAHVFLNSDNLKDTTALHEVIHPIVSSLISQNPQTLKLFSDQLKKHPDLHDTYFTNFAEQYYGGETEVNEEAITEFLASTVFEDAISKARQDKSVAQQLRDWFNSVLEALGLKSNQEAILGDDNVFVFAQKLSDAITHEQDIIMNPGTNGGISWGRSGKDFHADLELTMEENEGNFTLDEWYDMMGEFIDNGTTSKPRIKSIYESVHRTKKDQVDAENEVRDQILNRYIQKYFDKLGLDRDINADKKNLEDRVRLAFKAGWITPDHTGVVNLLERKVFDEMQSVEGEEVRPVLAEHERVALTLEYRLITYQINQLNDQIAKNPQGFTFELEEEIAELKAIQEDILMAGKIAGSGGGAALQAIQEGQDAIEAVANMISDEEMAALEQEAIDKFNEIRDSAEKAKADFLAAANDDSKLTEKHMEQKANQELKNLSKKTKFTKLSQEELNEALDKVRNHEAFAGLKFQKSNLNTDGLSEEDVKNLYLRLLREQVNRTVSEMVKEGQDIKDIGLLDVYSRIREGAGRWADVEYNTYVAALNYTSDRNIDETKKEIANTKRDLKSAVDKLNKIENFINGTVKKVSKNKRLRSKEVNALDDLIEDFMSAAVRSGSLTDGEVTNLLQRFSDLQKHYQLSFSDGQLNRNQFKKALDSVKEAREETLRSRQEESDKTKLEDIQEMEEKLNNGDYSVINKIFPITANKEKAQVVGKLHQEYKSKLAELKWEAAKLKHGDLYSPVTMFGREIETLTYFKKVLADLRINNKGEISNWKALRELWEVPRDMLAMGEMSYYLVQSNPYIMAQFAQGTFSLDGKKLSQVFTDPVKGGIMALNSMGLDKKQRRSEAEAAMAALRARPKYKLAVEYGLNLPSPGNPNATEDYFHSTLLSKLENTDARGNISKGIRGFSTAINRIKESSEDIFIVMMNRMKMTMFKQAMQHMQASGIDIYNPTKEERKELERVTNFVNGTFGSSDIKVEGVWGHLKAGLGLIFFAPRLFISRMRSVGTGVRSGAKVLGNLSIGREPKAYDKYVLGQTSKALGGYGMAWGLLFGVLLGLGISDWDDIELDPRDGDFMKVPIGDNSLDISGGFAPIFRMIARTVYLAGKGSWAEDIPYIGSYFDENLPQSVAFLNRWETTEAFSSFLGYKKHPTVNLGMSIITGKDVLGRRLGDSYATHVGMSFVHSLTPIYWQGLAEEYSNLRGPTGELESDDLASAIMGASILGVFGAGVVNYNNNWKDPVVENYVDGMKRARGGEEVPATFTFSNKTKRDGAPEWFYKNDAYTQWLRNETEDFTGHWIKEQLEQGNRPTYTQVQNYGNNMRRRLTLQKVSEIEGEGTMTEFQQLALKKNTTDIGYMATSLDNVDLKPYVQNKTYNEFEKMRPEIEANILEDIRELDKPIEEVDPETIEEIKQKHERRAQEKVRYEYVEKNGSLGRVTVDIEQVIEEDERGDYNELIKNLKSLKSEIPESDYKYFLRKLEELDT